MVDAWSGPTPNAQQFPGQPADAVAQLLDVIDRQKRELNDMRSNLLSSAGLEVAPEGLIVTEASTLEVRGGLSTSATGVTTLAGPTTISGSLTLPPATIDEIVAQIPTGSGNLITYATAPPSIDGETDGDTWWEIDAGEAVGLWRWSTSVEPDAWEPQTLGSAVLAGIEAGKIITGTLAAGVSITAGDPGAEHVVIDSDGLRHYDALGNVDVDLTGAPVFSGTVTGSDIIGGTIRTAVSGNRVEIVPDSLSVPGTGGGDVQFHTGHADEDYPGSLWAYGSDSSGGSVGELQLTPPYMGTKIAFLHMETSKDDVSSADDSSAVHLAAREITIGASSFYNTAEIRFSGKSVATEIPTRDLITSFTDAWDTKRIIVAADATDRNTVMANHTTTYGVVVSASNPFFVWQADTEQLLVTVDGTTWTAVGGGTSDHGTLGGLADDDHAQYHNDTRGDIRYYTKTATDSLLSAKAPAEIITTDGAVVTGSGGTTVTSAKSSKIGSQVAVAIALGNATYGSGAVNVTVGTLDSDLWPAARAGISGLTGSGASFMGVVETTGAIALRWTSGSGSGNSIFFSGGWVT